MRASFHWDGAQSVPSFLFANRRPCPGLYSAFFYCRLTEARPGVISIYFCFAAVRCGSRKVETHKKGERCEYEFSITTSALMVPARQRSSPASIASGCATTPSFISVDCCIVPEPYSMKKSSTATRTQSSISSIPPRQR